MEVRSLVINVAQRQHFAAANRRQGLAHQAAVHDDFGARGKIFRSEFVLGGHIGEQGKGAAVGLDGLAFFRSVEGNNGIVAGIKLKSFLGHESKTPR